MKCAYCAFINEPEPHEAPPPPPPEPSRHAIRDERRAATEEMVRAQAAKAARRIILAVVIVSMLSALLVAFKIASVTREATARVAGIGLSASSLASALSSHRGPDVPRGPDHFMWADQYASPVGVDANGDGVEDLAGPFVFDNAGKLEMYVGVLDGRDFHLLWKAGPFGIRDKATRKTGVAVAKNRMVAVEVMGLAHLFDLQDGRELSVFPYKESDSRGLCAPPDNDGVIFLGNGWSAGLLIDVATGKTRSVAQPKGCAYSGPRRPNDSGDTGSRRMRGNGAPPPDGFDWKRQPAGDEHDAFGIATPKGDLGTVIVGVDSKTKAVRWQESATTLFGREGLSVEPLEVGNGVLYAEVSARVVALNAATGDVKWRATWQGDAPFNETLTSSRLYVVSGEWPGLPVDVYDIASGKLLARLGHGRRD